MAKYTISDYEHDYDDYVNCKIVVDPLVAIFIDIVTGVVVVGVIVIVSYE